MKKKVIKAGKKGARARAQIRRQAMEAKSDAMPEVTPVAPSDDAQCPPSAKPKVQLRMLLALLAVAAAGALLYFVLSGGAQIAPYQPSIVPPQVGPQPPSAEPLPFPPSGPIAVLNASQDGGNYFFALAISDNASIKSVKVNGTQADFNLHGNGPALLQIPAQVDCSGPSQISVEIGYEQSGQNLTESGQISFPGCTEGSAGVEIILPPECKGAGEPCSGGDCCFGLACGAGWLCTTIPDNCALEGQACGTEPCCPELACDPETHTCRPQPSCGNVRTPCTVQSDCCPKIPPMVCRDLTCRYCSSENEVCVDDSDCCVGGSQMKCIGAVCTVS